MNLENIILLVFGSRVHLEVEVFRRCHPCKCLGTRNIAPSNENTNYLAKNIFHIFIKILLKEKMLQVFASPTTVFSSIHSWALLIKYLTSLITNSF